MKKILSVILLALLGIATYAQTDSCETAYIPDHPGYTYNAHNVGLHRMDIEIGLGYGNPYNLPWLNKKDGMFYNTTYVRYGVFKHLEFRFGFELGYDPKKDIKGLSGFNVGAKVPIISNLKNAPDIAILATTYIPKTGKLDIGGQFEYYAPNVTLAIQKCFFDKLVLFGNTGVYWDGFDKRTQYNASVAAYFFILPKWGIFGETACKFVDWRSPVNLWDAGTVVYITDNLQWDLSFGANYVTGLDNAFVNTGICWRLPYQWSK